MLPSQNYLRECLRYEPAAGRLFWLVRPLTHFQAKVFTAEHLANRWNATCSGEEAFCTNTGYGYLQGCLDQKSHLAHRVIWKLVTGRDPEKIDHINHCRSDNRWANLRDVSQAQNLRNQRRSDANASGCVGVRWHTVRQRWLAQIQIDGCNKHLGYFEDFDAAVLARKGAERRYGFHPNHGQARAA